jgi:NAD(P)-dependent dehydrogenase (short-subunit alcohol dehydrogenase family)
MTTGIVPGRFDGRTVVVTGAGAGIGRATVERLLAEGARVIATDVVPERLHALAGAVTDGAATEGALAGRLATVAGDASAEETVTAVVAAADGRIDGLANVAGIMDGFLPSEEIDDATWERVMSVNVTAVMRLTRAVLPLMRAAGSGSIVNVSSEAGLRGSAAGTAYTTSKHAVIGFTKSTAFFYTPQGIRCNAVAPGGVATSIEAPFRSAFAGERLGPIMQTNVPPLATSEQLAAAITWLLSDDSLNVSGTVLASDGGWAAV